MTGPQDSQEIVVTIRRRPPAPEWRLGPCLRWAVTAVAGDPVMLLLPVFGFAIFLLAALAFGVPGRPEVLVPLLVAPPADAFQDLGILRLAGVDGAWRWVAAAVLGVGRTALFAALIACAIQRTRGESASLAKARGMIRPRLRIAVIAGGFSFAYALLLSQQAFPETGRDTAISATGLTVGILLIPAMFVAALTSGGSFTRRLSSGLRKPVGLILLAVGYSGAINGLYRLAAFGEPGRAPTLPVTLYAVVVALTTAVFATVLVRRFTVLAEL